MNRADYNEYRGWKLPDNEDGADDGYLVEYADGGKPNDSRHAGYISWIPKSQFDAAYRETSGLTFGLALEMLKNGAKVRISSHPSQRCKRLGLSILQLGNVKRSTGDVEQCVRTYLVQPFTPLSFVDGRYKQAGELMVLDQDGTWS